MEITAEVKIKKRVGEPVSVSIDAKELVVSMGLAEFLTSLAAEIGSPATMFTASALEQRIQTAAGAVLHRMKKETRRL